MKNQLLRDTDWSSMAHSLEVRVPLVDVPLLQAIAPLAVTGSLGEGKSLLAGAPTRALPEAVTLRKKTGFSTPIATWLEKSGLPVMDKMEPIPQRIAGRASPKEPWARSWVRQLVAWHLKSSNEAIIGI